MKVGDLVKYIPDAEHVWGDLFGVIVKISERWGYLTVAWNDGSYDEDLVYGELELISESR